MDIHVRACAAVIAGACLWLGGVTLPARAGEEPKGPDDRDRAIERIDMMRMWRMTEELDLTEEEGAALFPALREIETDRRMLDRERGKTMRELRSTLRGEHPDAEAIRVLIDRLERNRERTRRLDDREYERVRSLLDTERLGRYILFERDFEREIREVILRSRRPGPRGDGPGGPSDRPRPIDRPPR